MDKFTPIYKDISFDKLEDYEKWLKETTKYNIEFEDKGQDLLGFSVAENMEIIHTDLWHLGSIYNGAFVCNGEPDELGMLQLHFNDGHKSYIKYQIEKVTKR